MKCCSCHTHCCEIFSACLSVHVLHLSCFSTLLTPLFSPPFLAPVFPFLLPGNLLPPVDIKRFVSTLCTKLLFFISKLIWGMWKRERGQRIFAHMFWVMCGHCTGTQECYRGGKKLDQGLLLLMGGDLQVAHFFSWAITEMLLPSHSWMRSSDRTWRSPCSRNTSSRVRRVSRRLWINSSKRCGSDTECLNHSWFTGRQELPPNPQKPRTTLEALDSLMLYLFLFYLPCSSSQHQVPYILWFRRALSFSRVHIKSKFYIESQTNLPEFKNTSVKMLVFFSL